MQPIKAVLVSIAAPFGGCLRASLYNHLTTQDLRFFQMSNYIKTQKLLPKYLLFAIQP